ncbi:hypothetical protein FACS189465_0240 [Clostridia bacterium]|nr:hypothetical protein FACS189465_0240 [Clostridia bacterium]
MLELNKKELSAGVHKTEKSTFESIEKLISDKINENERIVEAKERATKTIKNAEERIIQLQEEKAKAVLLESSKMFLNRKGPIATVGALMDAVLKHLAIDVQISNEQLGAGKAKIELLNANGANENELSDARKAVVTLEDKNKTDKAMQQWAQQIKVILAMSGNPLATTVAAGLLKFFNVNSSAGVPDAGSSAEAPNTSNPVSMERLIEAFRGLVKNPNANNTAGVSNANIMPGLLSILGILPPGPNGNSPGGAPSTNMDLSGLLGTLLSGSGLPTGSNDSSPGGGSE